VGWCACCWAGGWARVGAGGGAVLLAVVVDLEDDLALLLRGMLLGHSLLGAHINPIQELPDILFLDQAALVNVSSAKGNLLDVVAFKHQLILLLCWVCTTGFDTFSDRDTADQLFTQEVSDFDCFRILGHTHVDGKVSIRKSHSISEPLGHSGDHVGYVRADRFDTRFVLHASKPHFAAEFFVLLASDTHVVQCVLHIPLENATWAFHCDDSGFH